MMQKRTPPNLTASKRPLERNDLLPSNFRSTARPLAWNPAGGFVRLRHSGD
jgi:hypothetical protein